MIQSLSLQHALKYAAKGWKLFPARWDPLKKRHIGLVKWSKAATSDAAQIESWAARHPKAYFCVALEMSDLCAYHPSLLYFQKIFALYRGKRKTML